MASNYTNNYNLCQWAASDRVLRTEFNSDNAKIDAALAGKASASALSSLQSTVSGLSSGKASAADLKSLETVVNGLKTSKADKTALDSLKSTVTQHTSTLTKKGNCQIYAGSYQGSGVYGAQNPNTLTFAHKPILITIVSPNGTTLSLFQGQTKGMYSGTYFYPTWSGNSVSWYHNSSSTQQFNDHLTYLVFALLQIE